MLISYRKCKKTIYNVQNLETQVLVIRVGRFICPVLSTWCCPRLCDMRLFVSQIVLPVINY